MSCTRRHFGTSHCSPALAVPSSFVIYCSPLPLHDMAKGETKGRRIGEWWLELRGFVRCAVADCQVTSTCFSHQMFIAGRRIDQKDVDAGWKCRGKAVEDGREGLPCISTSRTSAATNPVRQNLRTIFLLSEVCPGYNVTVPFRLS